MSRPDVDPYEILGLEPGVSWEEIRTAYRRLVKKHHPDKNPGDPASEWIFKQVDQAYKDLKDIAGVHAVEESPRPTGSGPAQESDRQARGPQARARREDRRAQASKDSPRGNEQGQTEGEATGRAHFKLLPKWRWVEHVDWEGFRRNPPDWYVAHLTDLLRPRRPSVGWRILRTAVLVLTFAFAGVFLLMILSVLLGPFFGIHL